MVFNSFIGQTRQRRVVVRLVRENSFQQSAYCGLHPGRDKSNKTGNDEIRMRSPHPDLFVGVRDDNNVWPREISWGLDLQQRPPVYGKYSSLFAAAIFSASILITARS